MTISCVEAYRAGNAKKGREESPTCPQCKIAMVAIVHIDSFGNQPALDAYECGKCGHVVSRLSEVARYR